MTLQNIGSIIGLLAFTNYIFINITSEANAMKKIGLTIYALNVFHTGKYHGEEKHGHLTFIDMLSGFSKL